MVNKPLFAKCGLYTIDGIIMSNIDDFNKLIATK